MSDWANNGRVYALQAQARRTLQHLDGFRIDADVPKVMRDKLAELDRAVASRGKPTR